MSSLFLFTGPNRYAIRQERRTWEQEFIRKHGEENLQRFFGEALEFRSFVDDVSMMPFLAEKRLTVIQGLPRFTKEHIELLAKEIHPSSIVLFIEPSPDKRLSSSKAFLSLATIKDFPELSEGQLKAWMQKFVADRNATIDSAAVLTLLEIVGTDQDMLSQELEKILLTSTSITVRNVQQMAVPSGEQEIWTLTNMLAVGKRNEALRYASSLLQRGEDAFSLWSVMLWMLKNLVAVHAAHADGETNAGTIASNFGVPFASVRTLMPLAAKAKPESLSRLVDWAAETDIGLKSGMYRATQEAPEEVQSLVDQFIMKTTALSRG